MQFLRVAAATLNQTALDFSGNLARIRAVVKEAKAQGVELLALPELCLSGYGCEDAFFSLATAKQAEAALVELLEDVQGITVLVGLPHFYYGAMYNCAALLQDRKVLGVNAKRVLPREGVHYEPRWFKPWPFGKVAKTALAGMSVPLGDIRYRLGSVGVAVEICEEAWDSVPASAAHADAVDLILNPSASHFAIGKYSKREHLVANSSRSLQVIYVYANLVGVESGRMVYDGGVLIAEGGEIVTRGPRFGFGDGHVTYRDVNPELASLAKLKGKPVREPDRRDEAPELAVVEIKGQDPRHAKEGRVAPRTSGAHEVAYQPLTREEEFLHAEMLGLFDYLRKTGSQGYVVPLSGGCDSATVAVLVGHMVAAGVGELGSEAFAKRLSLRSAPSDVAGIVKAMLTCVYMKTENSGPVTEAAARAVALAVGSELRVADVASEVASYTRSAEAILGRPLTWEDDDVTLQNIQARARAPLVWMIANAEGKILVTTSNRSEAAVGYATMDGDTAGGLAPLAGIDKPFLRRWLKWAEARCSIGLGPLADLKLVNAQAPTAELRPPGTPQTDEEDLMPYAVLERIERYLVRDRLGAADILAMLSHDFPEMGEGTLKNHLAKFFGLWSRSQWKRERIAPAFHLDDVSLDPKTWCRFPILSRALEI